MTETLHTPRPSELVEHFLAEAISNSPQPLKDLALFLSSALSEDDWKTADRLLLALALRNRTSEPEAGAVAWCVPGSLDRLKEVDSPSLMWGNNRFNATVPLYTHPAPATADNNLGDLLARIHRDGGHRQAEIGADAASLEAEAKVVAMIATADKLRVAKEALETVCRLIKSGKREQSFDTASQALAALNEQPQ